MWVGVNKRHQSKSPESLSPDGTPASLNRAIWAPLVPMAPPTKCPGAPAVNSIVFVESLNQRLPDVVIFKAFFAVWRVFFASKILVEPLSRIAQGPPQRDVFPKFSNRRGYQVQARLILRLDCCSHASSLARGSPSAAPVPLILPVSLSRHNLEELQLPTVRVQVA